MKQPTQKAVDAMAAEIRKHVPNRRHAKSVRMVAEALAKFETALGVTKARKA